MPWRGAGVAIPVFALRSNDDIGVGEYLDLKLLVDLSVKSGFHLIQLLPVNDTSVNGMWWDSYPYRYNGLERTRRIMLSYMVSLEIYTS